MRGVANTSFSDLHLISVVRNGCFCCGLKHVTSMLPRVRLSGFCAVLPCPLLPILQGLRGAEASLQRQMAQWGKGLPRKPEDPSSDPLSGAEHVCVFL